MGITSKKTIQEVKEIFLNNNLILDVNSIYVNSKTKMLAYTTEGYKVLTHLHNISQGHSPSPFGNGNPYTIWNIVNIWIPKNAVEYELLSDTFTGALDENLTWNIKNSTLDSFKMSWARFYFGERHPATKVERMAESRRRKPKQVREEIEDLLKKNGAGNWKLVDNEEHNYINSQHELKFIDTNGYLTMNTLLNLQMGRGLQYYYKGYSETSTHNVKLWLSLNSEYTLKDGEFYKGDEYLMSFICKQHGIFKMNWTNMKLKHGCKLCYLESVTGKNNPNWDDTISLEERISRRKTEEYYTWRKTIYQRDNNTCQCCGMKNTQRKGLHAHHLNSYHWNKEGRIKVDNGILLCKKCHMIEENSFHSIYGGKNNTKEQFIEWLHKYQYHLKTSQLTLNKMLERREEV